MTNTDSTFLSGTGVGDRYIMGHILCMRDRCCENGF